LQDRSHVHVDRVLHIQIFGKVFPTRMISGKLLAILLIGAAGAVAGGIVIANGGGNSSPSPATPVTTVVPGTPSVGAPHK